MNYRVDLNWDDEASVWVATSEDIFGLVMEGGSADALIERVKLAVPELLELNGQPAGNTVEFQCCIPENRAEANTGFE